MTLFLLSDAGEEEEDGPVVESGEGGVEPDSYWKKKEAFLRGSTVSLGEKFSSGTFNDAFAVFSTIEHCLTCCVFVLKIFYMSQSKLVIFYMQKHFSCTLYLCILMMHIFLSTNVLLTQQFSSAPSITFPQVLPLKWI